MLPGGAQDPPQVSRALGVLFLCGSVLVTLHVALPDQEHVNAAALYAIGGLALVLGSASVIWAKQARAWTVHTVFAIGTTLICLGVYFSGVATGAYSVLFVWLVVMAASFFSTREIVAHVVWVLVASAITLGLVEDVRCLGRHPMDVRQPPARDSRGGDEPDRGRAQIDRRAAAHRDRGEGAPAARARAPRPPRSTHRAPQPAMVRAGDRPGPARASRQNAPLSVIALDLDQFKKYNDAHGHVAGDRLLKLLASPGPRPSGPPTSWPASAGTSSSSCCPIARPPRPSAWCGDSAGACRSGSRVGGNRLLGRARVSRAALRGADRAMYDAKERTAVHAVVEIESKAPPVRA